MKNVTVISKCYPINFISLLQFLSSVFCDGDISVYSELPTGSRAADLHVAGCIFLLLGLVDGALWQLDVGGQLSHQMSSQQELGLDAMVRNVH